MTTLSMLLLILSCAFVTWLPRIIPFIFVKKVQLPAVLLRWLTYVPVCILSALVFTNLFVKEQQSVTLNWPVFLAFIPALIAAIMTKSLSITVIVGVGAMAIIQLLL